MTTNTTGLNNRFRQFASRISIAVGTPRAFIIVIAFILCWAATGPLFGFSDTWQLIINTSASIVVSMMVFLIQNTQNRNNREIRLQLDELIRSVREARNSLLNIEDMTDEELDRLQAEFKRLHEREAKRDAAATNTSQEANQATP